MNPLGHNFFFKESLFIYFLCMHVTILYAVPTLVLGRVINFRMHYEIILCLSISGFMHAEAQKEKQRHWMGARSDDWWK